MPNQRAFVIFGNCRLEREGCNCIDWKEAVRCAAMISDGNTVDVERKELLIEVCITGSLYIVGSALSAAGWEEGDGCN